MLYDHLREVALIFFLFQKLETTKRKGKTDYIRQASKADIYNSESGLTSK